MKFVLLGLLLLSPKISFGVVDKSVKKTGTGQKPTVSTVVSTSISAKPDSMVKLPYVDTSIDLSRVLDFKNEFMLASEFYREGNDSSALETLLLINSTELLAGHYKYFLISEIYKRKGHYEKADSILRMRSSTARNPVWQRFFQKRRLQIYPFLSFSREQGLGFLNMQLRQEKSKYIKFKIILQILKLEGFTGELGNHDKLVTKLFGFNFPSNKLDSVYKLIIKKNKRKNLTAEMKLILAKYEKENDKFRAALKRCKNIIRSSNNQSYLKKARRLRADLHYSKEDYKKAIKFYKKHLEIYGNNKTIMSRLSRAYARIGNGASSKQWYKNFIEAFPKDIKVADIYWMWAWDEEADKHYDTAIVMYQKLLPHFIENKRGRWVNFRIGYINYKRERYSQAMTFFKKAQAQKGDWMAVPAGMYWEGKTLEKTGKKTAAYKKYLETFRTYPTSFYGIMAKTALINSKKWTPGMEDSTGFRSCSDDSLKKWLMDLSRSSREPDSGYISRYLTLGDLFRAGLDTMAYTTFKILYKHESKNPVFLYKYSELFVDFWEEKSYFLARKLGWKIESDSWSRVPSKVLKLIFPRPFKGMVTYYSIRFGQEQNFMYALMKQESGFSPKIGSPAGALGLMQVMPATGKMLANMEKIKNHNTADLTNAEINVRLGTRYLYNLQKKYDNDPAKVLCNYNAGPRPTRRWSDKHGKKPLDVFVEEIGYRETRDYVKKVMGNYWTYRELYSRN